MSADKTYLDLAKDVLENGDQKSDRTGTGTISTFGRQVRYDLSKGFPLLTTKKIFWNGVVDELLWFLEGGRCAFDSKNPFVSPRMNLKTLPKRSHNLWKHWAKEDGDLGRIYGAQWRNWTPGPYPFGHIDQIKNAIKQIKENPNSRRILVTAYSPHELYDMSLEPCHTMFQFYVNNGKLSCQLYQRSADLFLGVPFNIASYALLTHMIAQVCDLQVGEFIHTFGDLHIYNNHVDQIKLQMTRDPKDLPTLELNKEIKDIDNFTVNDIILSNYNPHPAIKAEVSI